MRRYRRAVIAAVSFSLLTVSAPAVAQDQSSVEPAGAAQEEVLQIFPSDSLFTDADPRVAFRVEGCTADDVTAASEAFASSTYKPADDVLTARIADGVDDGTFDVTFTCSDPQASQVEQYRLSRGESPGSGEDTDSGGGGGDDADEISISFTDGVFSNDDPRVAFRVSDCQSNRATARSPIFTRTSYDRGSRTVTARVERDTESGRYPLVVRCAGQPALRTRANITGRLGDADDDGFPEGGVDTGQGGADSGDGGTAVPPIAGWALLALSVPGLAWLVGSGRLKRRRDIA